jgi:putative serine protease PepD
VEWWPRSALSFDGGAAMEVKMHPDSTSTRSGRLAPVLALGLALFVAACSSSATTAVSGVTAFPNAGANAPAALELATPTPVDTGAAIPVNGGATALQDQQVRVIAAVKPSVVQIETKDGLGSGVVYDAKGDIVTNAHVVGSATSFTVTLSSGRAYPGSLVGSYLPDDVAVIRVSGASLTPATFGNSDSLAVGDFVLALGNPLGLASSVTEGIVSAMHRQVSEPNGNALPDVLQTSAAINPGNSGGALVDLSGQVVGIPTLAATDPQLGGSAPGIGFAISSNRARAIADQLIANGKVTNSGRAYMGIQLADTNAGVTIEAVSDGGPAAKAGLAAGDVITAIDGASTPNSETLVDLVAAYKPGDVVKLDVQHADGTKATLSLTLGQAPG